MAESKKVTRITATDDAPKKAKKTAVAATKSKAAAKPKQKTTTKSKTAKAIKAPIVTPEGTEAKGIFARIGGYFTGAWYELRQVRWPNRRATWALTLAVIIFSLFFVGIIVLLDMFFKFLFELIIA